VVVGEAVAIFFEPRILGQNRCLRCLGRLCQAIVRRMLLDKRLLDTQHFARPNRNTRIGAPEVATMRFRQSDSDGSSHVGNLWMIRSDRLGNHRYCPCRFDSRMLPIDISIPGWPLRSAGSPITESRLVPDHRSLRPLLCQLGGVLTRQGMVSMSFNRVPPHVHLTESPPLGGTPMARVPLPAVTLIGGRSESVSLERFE